MAARRAAWFSHAGLFLVLLAVVIVPPAHAQSDTDAPADIDWFRWHGLFTECNGNCGFAGFLGGYIETSGLDLHKRTPIIGWDWGDSQLAGATVSRRLITIADVIEIEPELGVAKRFGKMDAWEFWSAVWLRWTWFPWNDHVRHTFGVSTGLNYASHIDAEERRISNNNEGSKLLHYFSIEATVSLPEYPQWEAVFRLHHRSGAGRFKFLAPVSKSMWNSTWGGAQYFVVGARHRF